MPKVAKAVDVKERIKSNKIVLKENKTAVTDGMKKLIAGEEAEGDAVALRAALALFIKAARAVKVDAALLETL